jgi:trans-2,3-dihydro-3-hydroxyanthranilate isomerase
MGHRHRHDYRILDVFTTTALEGNPLAVVFDADDLDEGAMQRIAGEFNLSETVFCLEPANPAHTARLRIFTPTTELPFAGHPTVGAAVALARRAGDSGDPGMTRMMTLEEKIGLVRCAVRLHGEGAGETEFDLPATPALAHAAPPAEAVAAALRLAPHEIGFAKYTVSVAGAGIDFTYVPVNGLAAIRKARPNLEIWPQTFPDDHAAAFLFTAETERPGASYHARMFAPTLGIPEDPATGAAVAGLAAILMARGGFGDGTRSFVVEQGFEMGRPSLLRLEIEVVDGDLHAARLSGDAVVVAKGTLFV